MAEFPAFPVFTDAYLGDTTHLTTIEHGAYLLLLFVAWRSPGQCLPDDDTKLARYARMTRGQWVRIAPTIREFFTAKDGSLYQSRLTDEAKHVRQVRESQRAAGRASALKRKGRHSTNVQQTLNERATPSPSPTPSIDDTDVSSKRERAKLVSKPDEVEQQVWDDFQALRRKKGAPLTPTALNGIASQARQAGITLNAALAECCSRGWQGFKADWYLKDTRNGEYRNGSGSGTRQGDGFGRALARAAAAFGPDDDG